MIITGRSTIYTRLMVNQALAGNASFSAVVNIGQAVKAIQAVFRSAGTGQLSLFGIDYDGNIASDGTALNTTIAAGALSGALVLTEYGGNSRVGLVFTDKSAVANTVTFVDLWVTLA